MKLFTLSISHDLAADEGDEQLKERIGPPIGNLLPVLAHTPAAGSTVRVLFSPYL